MSGNNIFEKVLFNNLKQAGGNKNIGIIPKDLAGPNPPFVEHWMRVIEKSDKRDSDKQKTSSSKSSFPFPEKKKSDELGRAIPDTEEYLEKQKQEQERTKREKQEQEEQERTKREKQEQERKEREKQEQKLNVSKIEKNNTELIKKYQDIIDTKIKKYKQDIIFVKKVDENNLLYNDIKSLIINKKPLSDKSLKILVCAFFIIINYHSDRSSFKDISNIFIYSFFIKILLFHFKEFEKQEFLHYLNKAMVNHLKNTNTVVNEKQYKQLHTEILGKATGYISTNTNIDTINNILSNSIFNKIKLEEKHFYKKTEDCFMYLLNNTIYFNTSYDVKKLSNTLNHCFFKLVKEYNSKLYNLSINLIEHPKFDEWTETHKNKILEHYSNIVNELNINDIESSITKLGEKADNYFAIMTALNIDILGDGQTLIEKYNKITNKQKYCDDDKTYRKKLFNETSGVHATNITCDILKEQIIKNLITISVNSTMNNLARFTIALLLYDVYEVHSKNIDILKYEDDPWKLKYEKLIEKYKKDNDFNKLDYKKVKQFINEYTQIVTDLNFPLVGGFKEKYMDIKKRYLLLKNDKYNFINNK